MLLIVGRSINALRYVLGAAMTQDSQDDNARQRCCTDLIATEHRPD
jgi:hypothetical protein